MKIPLSEIIIGPRQRIDLGSMDDLDSMAEPSIGQLQPIGVTDKRVLLWGRRRLEKARLLGWTEIEAVVRSGVSPTDAQMIEYAEDAERKNRTWQEECLALYKLDHMKKLEEGFGYGGWTIRKMVAFTGFSQHKVAYMLQVAEELRRSQDDHNAGKETIWACSGVADAAKYVIAQTERTLYAEIERRRQLATSGNIQTIPKDDPDFVPEDGSPAPSDVPSGNNTPDEIIVRLQGRQMTYDSDKEYHAELSHLVLGYNVLPAAKTLLADLRPKGYAIFWLDSFNEQTLDLWLTSITDLNMHVLPFHLIWNKVKPEPNVGWPFARNYAQGIVIARSEQLLHGDPVSSVVSAIQDDPALLPVSVVDASLTPIVLQNMAVTIIGGVDPLDVVKLGRVPIWHEPDAERYKATVDRLTEYYHETIPNVTVR